VNVIDDITTTADGVDTYHLVKSAGRYKSDFIFFGLSYSFSLICYFIVLLPDSIQYLSNQWSDFENS